MLVTTPRDIGAAIRERRKKLGLDQAELAARIGVSRHWLIQVENGKTRATIGLLLRLLNALNLSLTISTNTETQQPTETAPSVPDPSAILNRARKTDR